MIDIKLLLSCVGVFECHNLLFTRESMKILNFSWNGEKMLENWDVLMKKELKGFFEYHHVFENMQKQSLVRVFTTVITELYFIIFFKKISWWSLSINPLKKQTFKIHLLFNWINFCSYLYTHFDGHESECVKKQRNIFLSLLTRL